FGADAFANRDVAVRPGGQPAVVIAAGTGRELEAREHELAVVRRRLVDWGVDRSAEPAPLRERARGGRDDEEECEPGDDRTAHASSLQQIPWRVCGVGRVATSPASASGFGSQ